MVTWKPVGRCGNFLFMCATAMAYAWKHGLEFTVPSTTNDPKWNPLYLPHLINPNYNPALPVTNIKETTHAFQPLPFKEEWRNRNIVLHGYWQTEKYFAEYRDRILEAFGFRWDLNWDTVSVHVRRGDYLTIKRGNLFKHPPVPKEWYLRAMALFPGYRFKFFSDDIQWCRDNFGHLDGVDFSLNTNEMDDLIDGSCCVHHICSASTFSWWQAWLNRNPDKKVIMPVHWITPGWNNLDCSDIVPANWIRLP